jgi:hypothetical protein
MQFEWPKMALLVHAQCLTRGRCGRRYNNANHDIAAAYLAAAGEIRSSAPDWAEAGAQLGGGSTSPFSMA